MGQLAESLTDEMNHLEAAIVEHPPAITEVFHHFTPGLYLRELHMPAGTLGTSMIHKFEHPFVLSKGRVRVISENEGSVVYQAPYVGKTLPGTRRALLVEEDAIWITAHVTDLTDVDAIVAAVTETPDNPMVAGHPHANHWRHGGSINLEPAAP
jgi:hypothetical protein